MNGLLYTSIYRCTVYWYINYSRSRLACWSHTPWNNDTHSVLKPLNWGLPLLRFPMFCTAAVQISSVSIPSLLSLILSSILHIYVSPLSFHPYLCAMNRRWQCFCFLLPLDQRPTCCFAITTASWWLLSIPVNLQCHYKHCGSPSSLSLSSALPPLPRLSNSQRSVLVGGLKQSVCG